MTSLASLSDLGVRLGQGLTDDARAQKLLDDASARVRRHTGQTFTATDATDRLAVCCGKAKIPHGPVITVTSVTVGGDALVVDTDYTIDGQTITFTDLGTLFATVVYQWGWASVPDDVVAAVCQIAGRAYGTNPVDSGTTSESLGGWSVSTGGAAASGALGLLAAEREVLDSYRPKAGPIRMGTWVH